MKIESRINCKNFQRMDNWKRYRYFIFINNALKCTVRDTGILLRMENKQKAFFNACRLTGNKLACNNLFAKSMNNSYLTISVTLSCLRRAHLLFLFLSPLFPSTATVTFLTLSRFTTNMMSITVSYCLMHAIERFHLTSTSIKQHSFGINYQTILQF